MSPEQVRAAVVDRRTDIWSFGCVLYELLAGKRAFPGPTIPEILASVLKSDPDWTALPKETPPEIQTLLRRCLEKDPARRLADIAAARVEMQPGSRSQATSVQTEHQSGRAFRSLAVLPHSEELAVTRCRDLQHFDVPIKFGQDGSA